MGEMQALATIAPTVISMATSMTLAMGLSELHSVRKYYRPMGPSYGEMIGQFSH